MVSPPGCYRKLTALGLEKGFDWQCISVGDMIQRESDSKSKNAQVIDECLAQCKYGK